MRLQLVVGQIDFFAQVPRMLRDFLRPAHVLSYGAAEPILLIGEFRINHLGLHRADRLKHHHFGQ